MIAVALTIAGSDSSGGAGVQADLKAMLANGVHGASVITALTAQNTRAVLGVHQVPSEFITQQLDAVASDLPISATKTGMLGDEAAVAAVIAGIKRHKLYPLIVDPVMVASSGRSLLSASALLRVQTELLPLARLITPNAVEAARLVGHPVETVEQAKRAALALAQLGCEAVLIKGGHLNQDASTVVDVLWDGVDFSLLTWPRLPADNSHGTGCTLASAITARLACGDNLAVAVATARAYVQGAIAHGLAMGGGPGPVDSGWFLRDGAADKTADVAG